MEPVSNTTELVWRAITASLVLAGFAIAYDRWVGGLTRQGRSDGYVSLIVAAGVGIVLAAGLFVVWPLGLSARLAALIVAAMFVPAGLPMIAGSVTRHVQTREQELKRIYAEVLREDEETL